MVVNSSQDTEITLGTAKLLGLFFGLVMVCAVFFALGYTLGRRSDAGLTSLSTVAAPQTSSNRSKPAGAASGQPAQPMTFYKSVEQKGSNAQLTPATSDSGSSTSSAAPPESSPAASSTASQVQPPHPAVPPIPWCQSPWAATSCKSQRSPNRKTPNLWWTRSRKNNIPLSSPTIPPPTNFFVSSSAPSATSKMRRACARASSMTDITRFSRSEVPL